MNEGESAGGGHQGSNPAPPAVTDRRTTILPVSIGTAATATAVKADGVPTPSLSPLSTTATAGGQNQSSLPTVVRVLSTGTGVGASASSGPALVTAATQDNSSSSLVVGSLLPAAGTPPVNPTVTTFNTPLDIRALKKRILEQKHQRLRNLKEKHTENVAELFYLQSGGSMMDYPNFRKKPPTSQFISFSNAYRLDQLVTEERVPVGSTISPQVQQQPSQQSTHQVADNIGTTIGAGNVAVAPVAAVTLTNTITTTATTISSTTSIVATTASANSPHIREKHAATSAVHKTTPQTNSTTASSAGGTAVAAAVRGSSTSTSSTVTGVKQTSHQSSVTTTQSPTSTSSVDVTDKTLPQGAEIKIPAVGATPVAVSTKLPAAVVQLTQKGGTPLIPCSTSSGTTTLRRNANGAGTTATAAANTTAVAEQGLLVSQPTSVTLGTTKASSVAAAAGGGTNVTPTTTSSATANAGGVIGTPISGSGSAASPSAQEFSFKAKQEVTVMQRVSELQREGLWTEKRLPKLQEPSRPKAHWDYLLEEMVWLAADFAQERKWKKNAAKKCARMVQKHFQDKANAALKAEKAQELHLRRIASFISKEVKMFWSNVEKLVEYKHNVKLEEKRKKALDQHLSFIVDQTEKFSQQLAEGMNKALPDAAAPTSGAASINSSRLSSPKPRVASDDEFRPDSASDDDDEETIAKAEEEAIDVNAEVAALEKESQMDLDDFLKDLPKGYLENRDKIVLDEQNDGSDDEDDDADNDDNEPKATERKQKEECAESSKGDDEDDEEFKANEASDDDEKTIMKQEAEEMEVDHKKELEELEADNDLTVEELMEKYKSEGAAGGEKDPLDTTSPLDKVEPMEVDSDDDSLPANADSSDEVSTANEDSDAGSEDETAEEDDESCSETDNNEQDGLKSLLEDTDVNTKDEMIKDAAALAESIQPKGNTLSSTDVKTPVPFLLKHTLREYQHIGLDWLVTMNERKLNGILADEMGLGKTIQTIALLAHLACVKGNWGPHLIVVPSSVMLNWEMEFKKWCPGFKILTYYGSQKERKAKRIGWTKPNAFHVCITSYKLVVQDQQSFRRKKWKYLILDEAQNIKNFKSQRWQLLLNFSTERRLLLTGTPLQNDLMELWSLMHFLMPYVFSSHREFKEWFSNPMTGMIEGNTEYNEVLITRLHKVIRPFLLRRLKKEVEKQMPKKYEHVVMCRLSNRQRYLYDDFMSRANTRETLQTGNLLSVINVLMQLRKVCNHPNMFEVRPTISPFQMEGICYELPRLVYDTMAYDPFSQINLRTLNLLLIELETTVTAYVSYKARTMAAPRKLIEEIDSLPEPPPPCPRGKFKFFVRVRDPQVQQNLSRHHNGLVRVGASPAMKTEGNKLVPIKSLDKPTTNVHKRVNTEINPIRPAKIFITTKPGSRVEASRISFHQPLMPAKITRVMQDGKPYLVLTPPKATTSGSITDGVGQNPGRLALVCKNGTVNTASVATASTSSARPLQRPLMRSNEAREAALISTIARQVKVVAAQKLQQQQVEKMDVDTEDDPLNANDSSSEMDPIFNMNEIKQQRKEQRLARLRLMASVNKRRVEAYPIYGADCRATLEGCIGASKMLAYSTWQTRGFSNCRVAMERSDGWTLNKILKSYVTRCEELKPIFANFVIFVPSACAPRMRFYVQHLNSAMVQRERAIEASITKEMSPKLALLHPINSAMTTQFPDPRLIQYDCGKLQTLDRLLRQLKSEQHRVLIFTQMTKMLDVLEAFLNYHGHIYLRLDGSTRVEQRQVLMERFNGDQRIFCFILSTRSGGVGINLTGADTVIFYDSDWNPTMDAQAQDRCHRIGQTRDVHIYRLVSEKTIEVNILKKANQKRMLSDMAIEGGNFTTSYFKSSTIKDLFNLEQHEQEAQSASATASVAPGADADKSATAASTSVAAATSGGNRSESPTGEVIDSEKQSLRVFESALAAAEDEQDVQATKTAKAEAAADLAEFDETIPIDEGADGANGAAAPGVELSKADLEMQNLVKQLSPIERYAMRFVEETGGVWTAEQLRAAEAEIEAQKREWEANRLAAMQKEEELLKQEAEADEMLTYNRKDANNQVNRKQENRDTNTSDSNKSRRMRKVPRAKLVQGVNSRGRGRGRGAASSLRAASGRGAGNSRGRGTSGNRVAIEHNNDNDNDDDDGDNVSSRKRTRRRNSSDESNSQGEEEVDEQQQSKKISLRNRNFNFNKNSNSNQIQIQRVQKQQQQQKQKHFINDRSVSPVSSISSARSSSSINQNGDVPHHVADTNTVTSATVFTRRGRTSNNNNNKRIGRIHSSVVVGSKQVVSTTLPATTITENRPIRKTTRTSMAAAAAAEAQVDADEHPKVGSITRPNSVAMRGVQSRGGSTVAASGVGRSRHDVFPVSISATSANQIRVHRGNTNNQSTSLVQQRATGVSPAETRKRKLSLSSSRELRALCDGPTNAKRRVQILESPPAGGGRILRNNVRRGQVQDRDQLVAFKYVNVEELQSDQSERSLDEGEDEEDDNDQVEIDEAEDVAEDGDEEDGEEEENNIGSNPNSEAEASDAEDFSGYLDKSKQAQRDKNEKKHKDQTDESAHEEPMYELSEDDDVVGFDEDSMKNENIVIRQPSHVRPRTYVVRPRNARNRRSRIDEDEDDVGEEGNENDNDNEEEQEEEQEEEEEQGEEEQGEDEDEEEGEDEEDDQEEEEEKEEELEAEIKENDEESNCSSPVGKNSNSVDDWNEHAQGQDTTTNSTYYNVSEESESDSETETAHAGNVSSKKTSTPTIGGVGGKSSRRSETPSHHSSSLRHNNHRMVTSPANHKNNESDTVTAPRTRSRGAVKLDLWTLDVSPVLSSTRSHLRSSVGVRGKSVTPSTSTASGRTGNPKREFRNQNYKMTVIEDATIDSDEEHDEENGTDNEEDTLVNSDDNDESDREQERVVENRYRYRNATKNPVTPTPVRIVANKSLRGIATPPSRDATVHPKANTARRGRGRLTGGGPLRIETVKGAASSTATTTITSTSTSSGGVVTLHRWLLKSPKVCLRNINPAQYGITVPDKLNSVRAADTPVGSIKPTTSASSAAAMAGHKL